ncbi:MAG: hypothetical protein JHC33_04545 [Ignisphaera sp.]|jgi:hypothetical protein|nr:hypothetical protein [Ignisphaera sp.]
MSSYKQDCDKIELSGTVYGVAPEDDGECPLLEVMYNDEDDDQMSIYITITDGDGESVSGIFDTRTVIKLMEKFSGF